MPVGCPCSGNQRLRRRTMTKRKHRDGKHIFQRECRVLLRSSHLCSHLLGILSPPSPSKALLPRPFSAFCASPYTPHFQAPVSVHHRAANLLCSSLRSHIFSSIPPAFDQLSAAFLSCPPLSWPTGDSFSPARRLSATGSLLAYTKLRFFVCCSPCLSYHAHAARASHHIC